MNTETPFEVFVRIRPVFMNEKPKRSVQARSQSNCCPELSITDPILNVQKFYAFNGVFSENFSNKEVYSHTLKNLIPRLLEGYNTTCFAYGSTGSGKTHTMFGPSNNLGLGLSTLSIHDLFSMSEDCVRKLSFLEIYNETVVDLLNFKNKNLMIVEDPIKGVLVQDLLEVNVNKIEEVTELIAKGNRNRARASTLANEFSTRSHGVLQILVEKATNTSVVASKLCFIDLAGSERAATTENKGLRMKEGANINKSLLALGNCINILSDYRKKGAYVPFRDSKLTRLLKESLGGNSKTVMIACISPLQSCYEDTFQTLKYASRARNIKNTCSKVIKQNDYVEIINSLKSEIEVLKVQLTKDPKNNNFSSPETVDSKFLSQQIIQNFEEHWEIKQSIHEIEDLNTQNSKILEETEEDYKRGLLKSNIFENDKRKNQLLQDLYCNMKQKQLLQTKISEIKDDTKRELLDLQILVRTLKLEKIDLFVQNTNFKQVVEEVKKESEKKDLIIEKMQAEINEMRSKISRQASFSSMRFENISPICADENFPVKKVHKAHNSLQHARNIKKETKNRLLKFEKQTVNFIKDYVPNAFSESQVTEEEEGKVNVPCNTNLRKGSIDFAYEQKVGKKGLFSGLNVSNRAVSAEKLKKSESKRPKLVEISVESLMNSRSVLQKKDLNVPSLFLKKSFLNK